MRNALGLAVVTFIGLTLVSPAILAEEATAIMKKSHLAVYYAANDGVADVEMTIVDRRGKERSKEFSMLRLDEEEGGNQKYYTYFKKPSDVARLTFMVYKTADGNDMRWIYVPSVDLVKPISADDKNSSFVGSHFSYEDVSGRHWSEDNHTLIGDSTVGGTAVYVVESVPKEPYKGFARKVSYIDKQSYLPLIERYYDKKGELARVFRAEKVEKIDGIPTMTIRSMEDVDNGGKTTIHFSHIDYDVGLESALFTERHLKNPPRQYLK
jgi:outer membrane lipoprotein-sorting protein